jgi:ribosome-binding factor A
MTRPERLRRVDEAVRKVLSEGIAELKDPRIGFVTVTAVQVTNDLEHATVWVSIFGTDRERERTMQALEGAAGVLQGRINRELHLRRTPHLRFTYDAAVERGVRMSSLIDELAPPDDGTAETDDGTD